MSVDTVFTVPKDRLNVTIRLDKGATLDGEIFMESAANELSVHQKVTAFLENNNTFFPIKLSATGSTEFINKQNVWVVDVTIPEGPDADYFLFRPMHAISITALFNDGKTVSGEAHG